MIPTIGRSKNGNLCAWCLAAAGVRANPRDSHGICQRHYEELKAQVVAKRAARATP